MADHLAEAISRAAETELVALLETMCDVLGIDLDADEALTVSEALAAALQLGVRIGAVEATASLTEAGHDVHLILVELPEQ